MLHPPCSATAAQNLLPSYPGPLDAHPVRASARAPKVHPRRQVRLPARENAADLLGPARAPKPRLQSRGGRGTRDGRMLVWKTCVPSRRRRPPVPLDTTTIWLSYKPVSLRMDNTVGQTVCRYGHANNGGERGFCRKAEGRPLARAQAHFDADRACRSVQPALARSIRDTASGAEVARRYRDARARQDRGAGAADERAGHLAPVRIAGTTGDQRTRSGTATRNALRADRQGVCDHRRT
ncbi:hypothetical protein D3C71_1516670 [compost metagenome]